MIAVLTGRLIEKQPPQLILDVNGVGYQLEAPMTTFYQLPDCEQTVRLWTVLVVREDAQLLYGFHDTTARDLFKLLIKASGVGPKLSLMILSSMQANEFFHCIAERDSARLVKLPGVGKKTAERLIIELQDKVKGLASAATPTVSTELAPSMAQVSTKQEAINALTALGYKTAEAARSVNAVFQAELSTEALIRAALKGHATC